MKKQIFVKILGDKTTLWENIQNFLSLIKQNLSEKDNIEIIEDKKKLPLESIMQITISYGKITIIALAIYESSQTVHLYKNISDWFLLFLNGKINLSNFE